MKFLFPLLVAAVACAAELPPSANQVVDFVRDIQPLFQAECVKCHAKGRDKGGFSLETRASFLKGGDTGPAAIPGDGAKSLVIEMVAGVDPDKVMPKKGARWTAQQVGLLRAWIDQGAIWPDGITFAKPPPQNLRLHKVVLPAGEANPVDRLLGSYFSSRGIAPPAPVPDSVFARRAYLDVIGLLPTPEQLATFEKDTAADKRTVLVRELLADRRGYADHWMTFWNDLLRNDYRGTGFIDGGRKQITGWLFDALMSNKPYDKFVAELVAPSEASEGFTSGILWRGNVNASMAPPMQAAQSVSQVFLGINLKCASCHDSFINDWALADCYGMAAVFSDEQLELVRCDKPQGKKAITRFLYPELGGIDPNLAKPARLHRLAEIMVSPTDGRLPLTIVNRIWARLMGRGLIEPLDDMEKPAWNRDLLDWLAGDLVEHGWDLKHTIETIMTSGAYALPTVETPMDDKQAFVFKGPQTRRMTAEQFSDAVTALTGDWERLPSSIEFDFGTEDTAGAITMPEWIWTDEAIDLGLRREATHKARAALASAEAAAAAGKGDDQVAAARKQLDAAATLKAIGDPGEVKVRPDTDKHRVVFRRHFKLVTGAADAYAVLAASQAFDLYVNGTTAKPRLTDGFRNGRVKIYDIRQLLKPGDNVIAISVWSHTDKGMNTTERGQHPESINHLNAIPGVAFHVRIGLPGNRAPVQVGTDATWRVRRAPEAGWADLKFSDKEWATAHALPRGTAPIDEGPALPPVRRKDFANIPVALGPILKPAVSTAACASEIRAALLASNPLEAALDRPNREVIVPARSTTATTMQALELTNGATLDSRLKAAARKLTPLAALDAPAWVDRTYLHTFSRLPREQERAVAVELLGAEPTQETVADLLWAIVNMPEFQLIN